MLDYTEDELEEIELLKEEATFLGISLELAIEDLEPLAILRQILEETPVDLINYSY